MAKRGRGGYREAPRTTKSVVRLPTKAEQAELDREKKRKFRTQPIRMTVGFAILALRIQEEKAGRFFSSPPTPEQLQRATESHPDLIPEPWTLAQCRWALENPNELITPEEEK